jgi:hypothetical protein
MAITVKELEALKPEDHGKKIADGKSTYIRIYCSKDRKISAAFTWRYRHDKNVYEIPLGTWPTYSVTELRAFRDKLQGEKAAAIAESKPLPKQRREIEKIRQQAIAIEELKAQKDRLSELTKADTRVTVSNYFEFWRTNALHSTFDKGAEVERDFKKDVFPVIGELALEDVNKHHIQTIIDNMAPRGGVRMTKRVLSSLCQMLRYA